MDVSYGMFETMGHRAPLTVWLKDSESSHSAGKKGVQGWVLQKNNENINEWLDVPKILGEGKPC